MSASKKSGHEVHRHRSLRGIGSGHGPSQGRGAPRGDPRGDHRRDRARAGWRRPASPTSPGRWGSARPWCSTTSTPRTPCSPRLSRTPSSATRTGWTRRWPRRVTPRRAAARVLTSYGPTGAAHGWTLWIDAWARHCASPQIRLVCASWTGVGAIARACDRRTASRRARSPAPTRSRRWPASGALLDGLSVAAWSTASRASPRAPLTPAARTDAPRWAGAPAGRPRAAVRR